MGYASGIAVYIQKTYGTYWGKRLRYRPFMRIHWPQTSNMKTSVWFSATTSTANSAADLLWRSWLQRHRHWLANFLRQTGVLYKMSILRSFPSFDEQVLMNFEVGLCAQWAQRHLWWHNHNHEKMLVRIWVHRILVNIRMPVDLFEGCWEMLCKQDCNQFSRLEISVLHVRIHFLV